MTKALPPAESSATSAAAPAAAHAAAPGIICTVDVVLLTLRDRALHVVLLKRRGEPYAGALALPGGYIHPEEDATAWDAAARMLREKTGIVSPYLEQLATYSGRQRDPRGWSMSVVYYALVPDELLPHDGDGLSVVPVAELPELPFDHAEIVQLAVSRVRAKSQYSSLPVYLCGERITLPQLQAVYEAVLGEPINKVSFRRKVEELGMLEPVEGELVTGAAHRPAQVYRLRPAFRRELSTVQRGLNA
ncbi:bifunctional nicotinamide mononucleotide adenylyltransferase/ADP-ribose pyrophosphatase [Bordetella ansorpii]|uniref:Bifunctional nicotinamide mononucleotide adenylyltransferase/ADP-ribose pyrophosphatase n=1 Tax=Bordetella ansorpii TaxID=288768 RepID=A0A157S725_9BORD|nr:NUDIX domain-containing protein [Bordetella ansorpii]SAI66195.1 bifunctional nicotinamide mononucleotide adenylyltransferase/ADP-ribose pyrophosphatase [Bordetella ansorpii]